MQAVVEKLFPLSTEVSTIAPHALIRTSRGQVFGEPDQEDLIITDLHVRSVFIGGRRLTLHIRQWLTDHRYHFSTLFAHPELVEQIAVAFPRLHHYVVDFVSYEYRRPDRPALPETGVRPVVQQDLKWFASLDAEWLWGHLRSPVDLLEASPYGSFVGDRLVSIAVCTFEAGPYADMAVATTPNYRRSGAAYACCASLVNHLHQKGLIPVWNSATTHTASHNLAQKLGFTEVSRFKGIWLK